MSTKTPVNVTFRANQSFFLPLSLAQFAVLYDLTQGEFRLQVRDATDNPAIVCNFDSVGIGPGVIFYEPASQVLYVTADYATVKTYLAAQAAYLYDLQYTIRDTAGNSLVVRDLCFGTFTNNQGVTRS